MTEMAFSFPSFLLGILLIIALLLIFNVAARTNSGINTFYTSILAVR